MSKIYVAKITGDDIEDMTNVYDDSLVVGSSLNFSLSNPIKAVGRYESEDIVKVYWTDGYNNVRWANVVDPDLAIQSADRFEFLPNLNLSRPELHDFTSGNLENGVIIYSYQLFKLYGAETKISSPSVPIFLSPGSLGSSNNARDQFGGDIGETSGKGVKIKIDLSNNEGFDKLRLISIFYTTLNSAPSIKIVTELDISNHTGYIYCTDTGNFVGELTYDEYLIYGGTLFIAEDLEIKDNILFAANIKESSFDIDDDFDVRAYRFNSSGYSIIHENNDSFYVIYKAGLTRYGQGGVSSEGDWEYFSITGAFSGSPIEGIDYGSDWSIPKGADCINDTNDLDNDIYWDSTKEYTIAGSVRTLNYPFIYNTDGSSIGAKGKNLVWGYSINNFEVNTSPSSVSPAYPYVGSEETETNKSYKNTASPWRAGYYRGWQRDETYRMGLVFYDEKGRSSFARWSLDYRLPNEKIVDFFSSSSRMRDIYPTAYIRLGCSLPSAGGFRIVRANRGANDRSVLFQGWIEAVDTGVTPAIPSVLEFPTGGDGNKLVRLFSPEINYNKNINFIYGDYLEYVGYSTIANDITQAGLYSERRSMVTLYRVWQPLSAHRKNNSDRYSDIKSMLIIEPSSEIVNIGSYTYSNYAKKEIFGHDHYNAVGGTCLLVELDNLDWLGTYYPILMQGTYPVSTFCYYRRNVFASQYGGHSYEDRANTIYYPCSDIGKGVYSTVYARQGDTFSCFHSVLSLIWDLEKDLTVNSSAGPPIIPCKSHQQIVHFPVQSSINCNLAHGTSVIKDNTTTYLTADPTQLMQEVSGLHVDDSATYEYDQETDLYQYNSVYSQTSTAEVFFPRPFIFNEETEYDTRVKNSQVKVNMEVSDSWTNFLANDYLDVSSKAGPLNSIREFNGTLYFWQDQAFGRLFVNERSLISDNIGALTLGTGGVLSGFDYTSTKIGNRNKFGIIQSPGLMYWVDNNKEFIKFSGEGLVPLNISKGIKSYVDIYKDFHDVITVYDNKNKEGIFTVFAGERVLVTDVGWEKWPADNSIFANKDIITIELQVEDYNDYDELDIGDDIYLNKEKLYFLEPDVVENKIKIGGLDYTEESLEYFEDYSDKVVTVSELEDKFTIVFSELIDGFTGFYDFAPRIYMDIENNYFLSSDDLNKIYIHNKGDYCNYYGTYYNPELTVIFNPDYLYTKSFDNLSWASRSLDVIGTNIFSNTWTSVRFYNDYQNTDWYDLVYKTAADRSELPYEYRERSFFTYIPRNAVKDDVSDNPDIFDVTNIDKTQLYKERMRDKYLTADFVYDINWDYPNIYKFSIPYFNIFYRHSIR